MKKFLTFLIAMFITVSAFTQVSNTWGKYQSGDTIRAESYGHERYASKKGRVTYVGYMWPKRSFTLFKRDVNRYYITDETGEKLKCASHSISIIGNPVKDMFGLRYDYLPEFNSRIGFYASFEKTNAWHGSKTPSKVLFHRPIIPEPTIDVTYSNSSNYVKNLHNYRPGNCDPNPLCPGCPTCEPEYIYIHDTTWVYTTEYVYVPPTEEIIYADDMYTTSIGLSYHIIYPISLYVSGGISLHGYTMNDEFNIPFNCKDCKPITGEVGIAANVWRGLVSIKYNTFRNYAEFGIGFLF